MNFKERVQNTARYTVKFSMEELIPSLEKRISQIKGEEYIIDCFITNQDNSSIADVDYVAFPATESYVNAIVVHDGILYTNKKKNAKEQSFLIKNIDEALQDPDTVKELKADCSEFTKVMESGKTINIGHEQIEVKDMFNYLHIEKPSKYYLYNEFFNYSENVDIEDTIMEFAAQKTISSEAENSIAVNIIDKLKFDDLKQILEHIQKEKNYK